MKNFCCGLSFVTFFVKYTDAELTGLIGMKFDHDFGYSFPLFSSHIKKEKGELAKIVIKTHAFETG